MKRQGEQLAIWPNLEPPAPKAPRPPAELSGVTRAEVDALQGRAVRAQELAAQVKTAELGKDALAIAKHLLRLTLSEAEGELPWLAIVVEACAHHGALLEEVLTNGKHTGPVKHARDEAFHELRRRTGRSYAVIAHVFGCTHGTVSAGATAHGGRQRDAAAAAPAPSAPHSLPAPATSGQWDALEDEAAPASGPAMRTG
jgi:hypothetical protein